MKKMVLLCALFVHISLQAMDATTFMYDEKKIEDRQCEAEESKLVGFLPELQENIYFHCAGVSTNRGCDLKQHIKTLMRLRSVCKYFNVVLTNKKIGEVCSHYDDDVKKTVFGNLVRGINFVTYWRKKNPCLTLVHAGVHPDYVNNKEDSPLLVRGVLYNDQELLKTLFDYGAQVNAKTGGGTPVLFFVKTKKMAELLVQHGVDLQVSWMGRENIVSDLLSRSELSPDLLVFFIEKGVDVKGCDVFNGQCLLHLIHKKESYIKDSIVVERARVLLPKMQDMVNTVDVYGKTPLDRILKKESKYPKLIALFREYGAKTAQELNA